MIKKVKVAFMRVFLTVNRHNKIIFRGGCQGGIVSLLDSIVYYIGGWVSSHKLCCVVHWPPTPLFIYPRKAAFETGVIIWILNWILSPHLSSYLSVSTKFLILDPCFRKGPMNSLLYIHILWFFLELSHRNYLIFYFLVPVW